MLKRALATALASILAVACTSMQAVKKDGAADKRYPAEETKNVVSCSILNKGEAQVSEGVSCLTSKNVLFVRYQDSTTKKMGWKDTADKGHIWYDEESWAQSQMSAIHYCQSKKDQKLPSVSDFEIGVEHGVVETLYADVQALKPFALWSSSIDEKTVIDGNQYAFVFYPRNSDYRSIDIAPTYLGITRRITPLIRCISAD